MPDENIHLDDYGDGSQPEDKHWKFYGAFLFIIISVMGIYIISRFFL